MEIKEGYSYFSWLGVYPIICFTNDIIMILAVAAFFSLGLFLMTNMQRSLLMEEFDDFFS